MVRLPRRFALTFLIVRLLASLRVVVVVVIAAISDAIYARIRVLSCFGCCYTVPCWTPDGGGSGLHKTPDGPITDMER